MRKSLILWAVLILATALNLQYFLSRWAEPPLRGIPILLTERTASSLFIGASFGIVLLHLLDLLLRRRLLLVVGFCASLACLIFYAEKVPVFAPVLNPDWKFASIGALLALLCLRVQEQAESVSRRIRLSSLTLYTLASFNVFLLIAPFTSFVPAYVQDSESPAPSLAYFYYGSVHADISMVSVFFRRVINSFFEYPSINATILTSMILVALGLACAALAFEMLFGRAYAWVALLAAWTDRYIMAGALASSVVSMPILSVGSVFLLAVWGLVRQPGMLNWKEASAVGLFNAVSLLYSLYSYSAARIPWVIGSAVAAVALLIRGAIPFNVRGLTRVVVAIAPSLLLAASIVIFVFRSDVGRFKAQLLISPRPEQIIKDVNDYHVKVVPIHDVDGPIWWGTGRPEGINQTLYWRRTPREILDKATWFISEFRASMPPAPYSLIMAALSLIGALCSRFSLWRALAFISAFNLLGAFAAFILAQDTSAYRRALGTNLMILVPILTVLSTRSRKGLGKILSIALCAGFCVIKAPLELSALFDPRLHVPLCIACHDHFNVRVIVNDPVYQAVKDRRVVFVLDGNGIGGVYSKCAKNALVSYEMKTLSPKVESLFANQRPLRELFSTLAVGDVLVTTCPFRPATEGDIKAICEHSPPFGKFIGAIADPNRELFSTGPTQTKWVFIEKES
jgi:hypothetical protein